MLAKQPGGFGCLRESVSGRFKTPTNVRFDAESGHKVGRWWGRVSWRGAIAHFDGGFDRSDGGQRVRHTALKQPVHRVR